jgi:hypothetical protein
LLKYVEPANLPAKYGGECVCDPAIGGCVPRTGGVDFPENFGIPYAEVSAVSSHIFVSFYVEELFFFLIFPLFFLLVL